MITKRQINKHLIANNLTLGCVCSVDDCGNDYCFKFFFVPLGSTPENEVYLREIRKMENIAIWESDAKEAIENGVTSIGDII